MGEEALRFFRGERPRVEEPLPAPAAEGVKGVGLRPRLDALGDHLHPEILRERQDRFHDRRLRGGSGGGLN